MRKRTSVRISSARRASMRVSSIRVLVPSPRVSRAGAVASREQQQCRLDQVECAGEIDGRLAHLVKRVRGGADTLLTSRTVAGPVCNGERSEESAGAIAQPLQRLGDGVAIGLTLDSARRDEAFDVARQVLESVVADREAEVLRRDVLELMGFVDDRDVTRRNHLAVVALADRSVGAQQMVIHDDDVGLGGPLAHPRDEAVVVARTFGAEARVGGRRDVAPERQISSGRSSSSARSPVSVRPAHSRMIGRNTLVGRWAGALGDAGRADGGRDSSRVPSCRSRVNGDAERIAESWDVLEEDLLLQVLRAGGDEHALAAEDRGNEVRERLAGAGPGLREQQRRRPRKSAPRLSAIPACPDRGSKSGNAVASGPPGAKTAATRVASGTLPTELSGFPGPVWPAGDVAGGPISPRRPGTEGTSGTASRLPRGPCRARLHRPAS